MMAPIKFAAAAGLVGGIWIPYLAAVTSAALILYFVIAISMHIAARDFGCPLEHRADRPYSTE